MMKSGNRIYRNWLYALLLIVFSSCIDETFTENTVEGTFLTVRGITPLGATTHEGTPEDRVVRTLRILAFDRTTGNKISNVSYAASTGDIIRHPIDPGTYDFVFLANEPPHIPVKTKLEAIGNYSDLNHIAYPASFFSSEQLIPMMQEIKNVTVLSNGQGATLENGTTVSMLLLALERLGVRVDVELKAVDDLNSVFKGVIFSNIPNLVPLTAGYDGPAIERNVVRKFTLTDDGGYFADGTPTAEWGWGKKVNRIILPASEPASVNDEDEAVIFTVDMVDNYSPSCELKINSSPVNYSLPKNTKLDLTGYIQDPLQVNIIASKWEDVDEDWDIVGVKVLNVSTLETGITDFNGARISFSSNMPIVKVLPELYVGATGTTKAETEKIFNDLVLKSNDTKDNGATITYATSRFLYTYDKTSQTGTGYMDVLLDEQNVKGARETYRIVLSVEDEDGGKLQREIKINTAQDGKRFVFDAYGTGYIGAFFRDDEVGERIITGQQARIAGASERPEDLGAISPWKATVESGDFVVLSSTPSFDPRVGMDDPGNPEHYQVLPNAYKGEGGTYVEGRGRVYFRIGVKGKNTGATPRYARVKIERYGGRWGTGDNQVWYSAEYLYVRQGEEPDYIMRPGTADPISKGPLQGKSRDYARKISPYNLTSPAYYNGSNALYTPVDHKQAKFVKYPSQAGAFFQWGLPKKANQDYFRLAYHPTALTVDHWIKDIQFLNETYKLFLPVWGAAPSSPEIIYDYGYTEVFESCPEGYHRPSDGYIDRVSYNGPYPNNLDQNGDHVIVDTDKNVIKANLVDYSDDIAFSELRQSLFINPLSGDAGLNSNIGGYDGSAGVGGIKVDRYQNFWKDRNSTSEAQEHMKFSIGFYADGFFDRRPVKMGSGDGNYPYCVSSENAQAAYMGILVYNESNGASVFFPSAGRRRNQNSSLEYAGQTGYYHTSSIAASSAEDPHAVWSMFLGKWPNPGLMYQLPTFGQSIRCVKNETSGTR
ncbi:hypothetical protein [Bacteroides sp.]|uniref:hypothetical protein n=1 Tax=Bacteroides sp. TaxID=29523 RepID=UPI0011DCC25F|nr:hypothetical protein [Bacteroides sp.]